jgi:hypothetical protein
MDSKSIDKAIAKRSKKRSNGCVVWQLARDNPRLRIGGQLVRVRRYLYEKYNGPIPEGREVLHVCGTAGCVNPEHLFLKTARVYVRPSRRKSKDTALLLLSAGWTPAGIAAVHGNARAQEAMSLLTAVARLIDDGYTIRSAAEELKVPATALRKAVKPYIKVPSCRNQNPRSISSPPPTAADVPQ